MKPLVIIKSCHRHYLRRCAIRDTWLPGLTWDRMFALGVKPANVGSVVGEANCLRFDVSDDFKDIAPKLAAALDWGLINGFGPFFICDDDTYVVPARLESLPSEGGFDYLGWYRADGGTPYPLPYIQGAGYFLSRLAARVVLVSKEMIDGVPDDVAVGRACYRDNRVNWTHDVRFHPGPVPELAPERITTHKCLPDDMRRIHAQYLSGHYAE